MQPLRLFLLLATLAGPLSGRAAPAEEDPLGPMLLEMARSEGDVRAGWIQQLANTGDLRLESIFDAFRSGSLYLWQERLYRCEEITMDDELNEFAHLLDLYTSEPATRPDGKPQQVPVEDITEVEANRKERKQLRSAVFLIGLSSPDPVKRLNAVKRCGDPPRQTEALEALKEMAQGDALAKIRYTAQESIQLILLADPGQEAASRAEAARHLGVLKSARALPVLVDLSASDESLLPHRAVLSDAASRIRSYQDKVKVFDNLKFGLSTGSVLILMALGLAITFGLMGVINMAHGELMMIGAYTTFVMQQSFGHTADDPNNWFFILSLPMSFMVAALVGGLIEFFVVRHLYRRPLESLLATFGVSLILIQLIRLIFGDNQACNSPTWLVGSFEVMQDMTLSYNRVFIFVLTALCVAGIYALMRLTPLGLRMRATMQNRNMAGSLGVNTRMVDASTFMLGAGLAGVAGCALTTVSGITPDMGQNYIVDAFLVVVTGGVGELLGVVYSGLGLGMLNKVLEGTVVGPVWAKIIILIAVIAFIQFKPSGLYAPKGRLADV